MPNGEVKLGLGLDTSNVAKDTQKVIKTISSEMANLRKLSGQALNFDADGKVKQLLADTEQLYENTKKTATARQAEIAYAKTLLEIDETRQKLAYAQAELPKAQEKLLKAEATKGKDSTAYRTLANQVQILTSNINAYTEALAKSETKLHVLENIKTHIDPRIDTSSIDKSTEQTSELISKMEELRNVATEVRDTVEPFEIIDDGFTNIAEAISNANEVLKEYNALLERRPQEAIDVYATGRDTDQEGSLVSRDVGSDIEELKAQLQSAEPDFARIQELAERLAPALEDLGTGADQLDRLKESARQAAENLDGTVVQITDDASGMGSAFGAGFEEATQSAEGLKASIDDVAEGAENTKSELGDINMGDGADKASGDIINLVNELNRLKTQLTSLKQKRDDVLSGKTTVSDEEWIQLNKDIEDVGASIEKVKIRIDNFGHGMERAVDATGNAMERASKLASAMNSKLLSGLKRVASGLKSVASTLKNNIIKTLNKVKSSFDKAFSSKNLKRSLVTLIKYTIGVRSLYFAFRKLRSAVQEGINNLVQFQSETNLTNQRMTEFKTSLLFLKNAWGAAFAPIINVVMPILNAFIDALANVANAIARFFAAITGQSTVIQALKVSVGDYAKSLSGAGGSAKKAADEQKKLNDRLAAFDDLNVLGKDKEDEDTSPSGGGGGADMPSVNDMFERIETPFNELAERLRKLWEKGDFFGMGELLGTALKEQLEKVDEWLQKEGREKILGWGKKIGEFIDGFISVDELAETIADVIADAIIDGIDFVDEIVTPERFEAIGDFIVRGVNEFIPKVVPKLGELFGNLLHSGISLAFGFITGADFDEWGKSLGDAINNFFTEMSGDGGKGGKNTLSGWQKLGISLSEGAKGLLDMIITAIKTLDTEEISKAIREFLETLDWDGIKEKLKELWDTVWEFLDEVLPDDFIDLDFESLKTDIEAIASAVSELVKNIPWGEIKDTLIAILNLLAGIEPEQWSAIAKGIMGVAIALEAIGALTKIITFIGMLSKGFSAITGALHAIEMSKAFMALEEGFQAFATETLPPILNGLAGILEIFVAIVGVVVSWREAIESFQEGGGFSALFDFFAEGLEEDGFAGFGKKLGELLLGAVGTALDDFRAGIDGLINSDNPLEVLWAAFTNDDDFLTGWADDLVQNSKDWETWAGGLISSAEGVLGVISDLSDIDMSDLLTGIWESIDIVSPITDVIDNWDSSKIDEALTNLGDYFVVGFEAIFGDGSEVQTSALGAWEECFDFDSSSITEGLSSFIEDTVARFEDFKTRSADKAEEFKSVVGEKFATFRDNFGSIVDSVKEKLDGWRANFEDGINFIKDTASSFKDSFIEGFNTFKDSLIEGLDVIKEALDFSETLEGMGEVFRGAFNSVVDVINSFLSVLASGINNIGSMLNNLSFDNPVTGTHYSLNIPTVSAIQIPHLAQGAVIPPNREFMAVLGDQTHGTNIEAPLDTIKQAVGEEFAPYFEEMIQATLQVVQAVNNKNLVIGDREIGKANARYVNQQKMIKGTML